jgi:hypothetical protein
LIDQPLVTIVVVNDEKPKSVIRVMDKDRFENEFRRYSGLWNRLVHVELVMVNERRSPKSVPIDMRVGKYEKRSKRPSIFQRELRMV